MVVGCGAARNAEQGKFKLPNRGTRKKHSRYVLSKLSLTQPL